MKKIISIMLAALMLLSLCACGKKEEAAPPVPDTMGGKLLSEFYDIVDFGETDPLAIAEKLLQSEVIEFEGMAMEMEPGYLMGFSQEIQGFEKAAVFSPMIGSIPFVGYVFALADSSETDAFCAMLKENADMRWNICTEAEELVCEGFGDIVFFVMCPGESAE